MDHAVEPFPDPTSLTRSRCRRSRALLRLAAAGCALAFGLIACDEASPPTEPEKPLVDYSFEGNHAGGAGNTDVNLAITRDSFTASAVSRVPGGASPGSADLASYRIRHAIARSAATEPTTGEAERFIFITLSGDVAASGSTVTATITEVERDGQKLTGDELARYTKCSINATTGANFGRQAIAAILACLGVQVDEDVEVYDRDPEPRETSILGTWAISKASLSLPEIHAVSISSSDLSISFATTICPLASAVPGPVGRPGRAGPDEVPPPDLLFKDRVGFGPIAIEGGPIEFEVRLSRETSETVTVDWATVDESGNLVAVAGADYTAARGTLTFPAGDLRRTFTVMTIDDNVVEGFKYFRVRLSNARGAHILIGSETASIIDDEDDRLCLTYDLHYDVEAIDESNINLTFREGAARVGLAPNDQGVSFDRSNFRNLGGSPLVPDRSVAELDINVSFTLVSSPTGDVAHFRYEGWTGGLDFGGLYERQGAQ